MTPESEQAGNPRTNPNLSRSGFPVSHAFWPSIRATYYGKNAVVTLIKSRLTAITRFPPAPTHCAFLVVKRLTNYHVVSLLPLVANSIEFLRSRPNSLATAAAGGGGGGCDLSLDLGGRETNRSPLAGHAQ
jgi:hypothetical protein